MDVGSRALQDDFTFKDFLQIISVFCNSPNHQEQALQQLYAGINQASRDSVTTYLEKIQNIAEDAYGLPTSWTINQASLVLQKVVTGSRSQELSQLTSSFVITKPFNFNLFRDVVIQYQMRLPSQPPAVNTISTLKCFKCQGQHMVKVCTVVCCLRCAGPHKASQCKIPQDNLTCNKCSLSNHNTAGHVEFRRKREPQVEEVAVYSITSDATSFMDGAVSINNGGKDSFVNSKLLVNTGALLPSGIAISEEFFYKRWGGTVDR